MLLALALPLLVFVQIVLAVAGGSVPAVGALHRLNALIIVGFTGYLAREATAGPGRVDAEPELYHSTRFQTPG